MTEPDSSNHETHAYSIKSLVDQLCDQFEKELRNGLKPKIEDFLKLVDEQTRGRLLRVLVALEFDVGQRDPVRDFPEYLERFPESSDILQSVQRELQLSPPVSKKTPATEVTIDATIVAAQPLQISHFKLLEIAGSGGFGTVWRAWDLKLQRTVAVKVLRTIRSGKVELSSSLREARVAANLSHPNIVRVYEVGEENGTPFIVTDFINGMTLKDWKNSRTIIPSEAARLVAKLAMALHYAHENNVIHRDLKLANVLMDAQGEPFVADFGLAKQEARDDSLAIDGQVIGTPAYMAPEQARADHAASDRRTDVYSIGVILYELLTGTIPFRGDVPELLRQVQVSPPVAPRSIKPEIPKDLEAICLKCLAKDNTKRYQTAKALADDLLLFLNGETLLGIPAALPNRIWKWFQRNRRSIFVTAAASLLVAIVSITAMAIRNRGALPAIPRYPVEITTEPSGCEITVVAIDPATGDPDPTQIQTARGKTPLTMSLASGDYLVVAVLDSQRFHEVYRHVPDQDEAIAFKYTSMNWKRRPSGVIEVSSIRIPRPDVSLGMAFCEGNDQLIEPGKKEGELENLWRIPPFYVDPNELTVADLIEMGIDQRLIPSTIEDGCYKSHFYNSTSRMEEIGKRLPTATELFYLSHIVCPDLKPAEDKLNPCSLGGKVLKGLHSDVWEWVSTKPGGAFTGSLLVPKSLGLEAQSRMIGSGDLAMPSPALEKQRVPTPTGFLLSQEHHENGGVRGVRSEKPRRTLSDFPSNVKRLVGPATN